MTRRTLLKSLAAPRSRGAFLFKARGSGGLFGGGERLGYMNADGSGERLFDFGRPDHTGWGVYDVFRDGRRVLMLSIEMNAEWKTKTFQEFYPNSRTHIWICDVVTGALREIGQKERLAPFYAPVAILPGEERMLVGVNRNGRERLYSMDLDGTRAQAVSRDDEYVYGVSVSPDGKRLAFHANYRIQVCGIDGSNRVEVGGHAGDIYFGTSWSPDGEWVLFQVCHARTDPAHDWSDIWIGRPDGRETRPLTQGQSAWFAASYGTANNPGSGSIMPKWAPDGSGILYARRLPGSKTPWAFQPNRKDTNHFNRDFKPEAAVGGTQIAWLDPKSGASKPLSATGRAHWDFRPDWSPDSSRILFCRAATGTNPAIWVMDRDGGNQRRLTDGVRSQGAEFPRWLPALY